MVNVMLLLIDMNLFLQLVSIHGFGFCEVDICYLIACIRPLSLLLKFFNYEEE